MMTVLCICTSITSVLFSFISLFSQQGVMPHVMLVLGAYVPVTSALKGLHAWNACAWELTSVTVVLLCSMVPVLAQSSPVPWCNTPWSYKPMTSVPGATGCSYLGTMITSLGSLPPNVCWEAECYCWLHCGTVAP